MNDEIHTQIWLSFQPPARWSSPVIQQRAVAGGVDRYVIPVELIDDQRTFLGGIYTTIMGNAERKSSFLPTTRLKHTKCCGTESNNLTAANQPKKGRIAGTRERQSAACNTGRIAAKRNY